MTHAICFNCGEPKFGCLVPCAACGAGPGGDDDAIALSFALSDHFMSRDDMARYAALIRTGQRLTVPEEFRDKALRAMGRGK